MSISNWSNKREPEKIIDLMIARMPEIWEESFSSIRSHISKIALQVDTIIQAKHQINHISSVDRDPRIEYKDIILTIKGIYNGIIEEKKKSMSWHNFSINNLNSSQFTHIVRNVIANLYPKNDYPEMLETVLTQLHLESEISWELDIIDDNNNYEQERQAIIWMLWDQIKPWTDWYDAAYDKAKRIYKWVGDSVSNIERLLFLSNKNHGLKTRTLNEEPTLKSTLLSFQKYANNWRGNFMSQRNDILLNDVNLEQISDFIKMIKNSEKIFLEQYKHFYAQLLGVLLKRNSPLLPKLLTQLKSVSSVTGMDNLYQTTEKQILWKNKNRH